jgi:hypothetical protein
MPDVLSTVQSATDAPPAFGGGTSAPDTDLSSLLPTKKQVESGTAALTSIQEKKMGAEDVMLRQFDARQEQDRSRMNAAMAAQGATIEELKHGTWNAQEEMGKRETSLWEQFGSPGFIIAMIGSRFSAMPMNSALQAGGAAMNALNQGKMDDYKRSFEAWQKNTELVIKRQQMEHELYEEIEHLRSSDMAAWRVKASAIATRFDDQRKLALLQNGMDPEVLEAIEGETKAAKEMSDVKTLLTERKMQMDALNLDKDWTSGDPARMKRAMDRMQAGKQTPEQDMWDSFRRGEPDATIDRQLEVYKEIQAGKYTYRSSGGAPTKEKEIAQIKADYKKTHPEASEEEAYKHAAQEVEKAHRTMTANEAMRQGSHLEQYDLVLTDVLPQAEDILRKHVGAAGAAGYVTRAGESVSNIFGSNDTDRRQFESDIDELKLHAPQLLLDRATGRPLSSEHELIDHIIRGLNMGDTTANTLRSLEELKKRLGALRQSAAERIGGSAPAAKPAAAPTSTGWDAYPEVGSSSPNKTPAAEIPE